MSYSPQIALWLSFSPIGNYLGKGCPLSLSDCVSFRSKEKVAALSFSPAVAGPEFRYK